MEFANRMFLQDDDEDASDEQGTFSMEELEPSSNFVNPVYETMFQVNDTCSKVYSYGSYSVRRFFLSFKNVLFQDATAPIIRPSADLSSFHKSVNLVQEETGLLRGNEQGPPGRAVIHTDSD